MGHDPQHLVASLVPERVVDVLEVVDVDEEDGEVFAFGATLLQHDFGLL